LPRSSDPAPTDQRMSAVHALGHPSSPPPQTSWDASARKPAGAPAVPADMSAPPLRPPAPPGAPVLRRGDGSDVIVTWAAAPIEADHGPATGVALRFAAADAWTLVLGVSCPHRLTDLPPATAIDVQLQAVNPAGASAWSVVSTLITGASAPVSPSAGPALPSNEGSRRSLSSARIRAARQRLFAGCHKVSALCRFLYRLARQLRSLWPRRRIFDPARRIRRRR
jgi:hypothetical protein